MSPWLTGDNAAPIGYVYRRVRIPNDLTLVMAVNGALIELAKAHNWEQFGSATPEETAALMSEMFEDYIGGNMFQVGAVLAYVTALPPDGTLFCDGSTYLRVDYPDLYDSLAAIFKLDADSFVVPDLRGRTLIGYGAGGGLTYRSIGDTGGEETHTLSAAEMPSHTHGYSGVLLTSTVVPPPVDGASPNPLPASTTSAGSDSPHNNMQPFLALRYCIVAR